MTAFSDFVVRRLLAGSRHGGKRPEAGIADMSPGDRTPTLLESPLRPVKDRNQVEAERLQALANCLASYYGSNHVVVIYEAAE
jgi:hypothetical protein